MKKKLPQKILIIPDVHCHPNYDNHRLTWLGKFLLDSRPDVVICLGDFADMPSLSSYDKGKASFEGRRYWKDIQAAQDGQRRLFAALEQRNRKKRAWKERQWMPRLVMCLGNHEDRINRIVNDIPELEGAISTQDLGFKGFGWEVFPYQEPIFIGGIGFSHCVATGVSGRPIGGVNHARMLINKNHNSVVVGHAHTVDWAEQARLDGTKIFGLSAGCYTHPDMIENWNRSTVHLWWRGVVVIEDLDGEGYYDQLHMITMRKLKRMYG